MRIKLDDLAVFQKICRKICINIPDSYAWNWDAQREMAVVVLDESDAELVFFPLFKEFSHHWNFSSTTASRESITEYINSEYGVLPGQVFFTSNPLCNLVLFVAWWPWGNEGNVSMRVGLIPWNNFRLRDGFVYHCMKHWLPIVDPPSDQTDSAEADTASPSVSTQQD